MHDNRGHRCVHAQLYGSGRDADANARAARKDGLGCGRRGCDGRVAQRAITGTPGADCTGSPRASSRGRRRLRALSREGLNSIVICATISNAGIPCWKATRTATWSLPCTTRACTPPGGIAIAHCAWLTRWGSSEVRPSCFRVRLLGHVLARWESVRGAQDIKISRLGGDVSAMFYHRPSLVQHVGARSTWGGNYHWARDYSGSWRAPWLLRSVVTQRHERRALIAGVERLRTPNRRMRRRRASWCRAQRRGCRPDYRIHVLSTPEHACASATEHNLAMTRC